MYNPRDPLENPATGLYGDNVVLKFYISVCCWLHYGLVGHAREDDITYNDHETNSTQACSQLDNH
jgi:hypothetical protein